jgi:hypothetical protein
MTRDDIIKLAREAGIKNDCDGIWCDADQLIAFAALVAAAEREACAKVCDGMDHNGVMIAADCAAAIRARGQS